MSIPRKTEKINTLEILYMNALANAQGVLVEALAYDSGIAQANTFISDLEGWSQMLTPRAGAAMLMHASEDIQMAAFSLSTGMYRSAFYGARLTLETILAACYFAANPLEYAEWQTGERDIHWVALTHSENGVFSKRFAKAFMPELASHQEAYGLKAKNTYRGLSEFVHANPATRESASSRRIEFNKVLHEQWTGFFQVLREVATFALCVRFLGDINRIDLARLDSGIMESIGHIEAIRVKLGAATTGA